MASRFFKDCTNLEQLRSVYKTFLKQFHPDNGGTAEQCAELNRQYAETLKYLKEHSATAESQSKGKSNPFQYDDEITEMLYKVVSLSGLEIEICGVWIWIGGLSYPHKETLKNLGFQWSKAKQKWHWSPYGNTTWHKGKASMEWIRSTYGSEKVETRQQTAIG